MENGSDTSPVSFMMTVAVAAVGSEHICPYSSRHELPPLDVACLVLNNSFSTIMAPAAPELGMMVASTLSLFSFLLLWMPFAPYRSLEIPQCNTYMGSVQWDGEVCSQLTPPWLVLWVVFTPTLHSKPWLGELNGGGEGSRETDPILVRKEAVF